MLLRVTEDDGSPPYLVTPMADAGLTPRQVKKVNNRPHATLAYVRHLGGVGGDCLPLVYPSVYPPSGVCT
jgi:hypothetical protein